MIVILINDKIKLNIYTKNNIRRFKRDLARRGVQFNCWML